MQVHKKVNSSTLAAELPEGEELVKEAEGFCYVDIHDELVTASQYILKAASGLLQAASAKLALPGKDKKLRTLRFKGRALNDVERFLVMKCISTREAFHVEQNQKIFNDDSEEIGIAERSYLVCPLQVDHKIILGALLIEEQYTVGKFNSEDLSLAMAFSKTFSRLMYSSFFDQNNKKLMVPFTANLLSLLENLYLYKSNLENNYLLSEMIKVAKMINSTLDIQSLLESIMESAKMVLKAEASSLMLIDKKTNELYFNIVSGEKEKDLKEIRVPMGVGIAGMVAETKQSTIVNDAQNDERVFKEADAKINFVTRNMIATPLMVRNKIIGVIEVLNSVGRADFSEQDLQLFKTFAEQAALAIHNRELIDSLKNINVELKKKVHELSSLHEIGKALITNLNPKDLFDSVVRIVADELEAEKVSIMLFNEEENYLEVVSQYGLSLRSMETLKVEVEGTLSGLAFKKNEVIASNDLDESPYASFRNDDWYHTGICIVHPLGQGDQVYGVLNISEKEGEEGFTEDDYRLVSTIASQITKGIQNFQLLDQMIEKKAFEKELEITSSIQKSILPSRKPQSEAFDIGVMSRPAKMMGGDFYDFYPYGDEDFAFSIADVSGKSLPAALFMAVSSSVLRTIGQEKSSPGAVLSRANDLIYQDSQSGMFVTVFFVSYNIRTRELHYASGGHNEQIIYRQETADIELLNAKGRPLGVLDSTPETYQERSTYLQSGDVLILYTDGVVEAINERKEEYGLERFKRLIIENHLLEPEQLVKKIYREVLDFSGSEPQFDDFTLMIIKIN